MAMGVEHAVFRGARSAETGGSMIKSHRRPGGERLPATGNPAGIVMSVPGRGAAVPWPSDGIVGSPIELQFHARRDHA